MFQLFKKKNKKIFRVSGMHCASCAMVIESELEEAGIVAKCSYAKQTLEIPEEHNVDEKKMNAILKKSGYTASSAS